MTRYVSSEKSDAEIAHAAEQPAVEGRHAQQREVEHRLAPAARSTATNATSSAALAASDAITGRAPAVRWL